MDTMHDDGFEVYVRLDPTHPYPFENAEQPVFHCGSYAEARRLRAQYRNSPHEYIIRYLGNTGGGD